MIGMPIIFTRKIFRLKINFTCHYILLQNSLLNNIHTYIHNWPLQPFSQDYGLASHTTHVMCVNFIRERRDLEFNVDSERQIFLRNFFMAVLFTLRVFARNLLRGSRRRNIFFIYHFWWLTWETNPGFCV